MSETLTAPQPLSPEEQATFDDLARRAQEGNLNDDERQAFDALTAPDHYGRDGVEPDQPEPYVFDENSLKAQVVDVSHGVVENARDHAAAHINRETSQQDGRNRFTRFAKGFAKKVWKGNIARDFINLRQQQIARDEIVEHGDLYRMQGGSGADHDRATAAVVERVASGFAREDESQKVLSEVHNGSQLETDLKGLVRRFAGGELDEASFTEEKTRLMNQFGRDKRANAKDRNTGLMFADNLLDVAKNAKAALAHNIGMDRVDAAIEAMKIGHADAKMGARTQVRHQAAEKLVDKLYESRRFGKVFSLANETTIVGAASLAIASSKFIGRKATAIASAASFGAVGAGIAYVRERLHTAQDRQTHSREMAEGGGDNLSHAGKRREQLEATRYETVPVSDLTEALTHAQEAAYEGPDGLTRALEALTHARTRVDMSDRHGIDLLQYSGKTSVEQERLALDIKLAEARAAVQDAIHNADDATLAAADIHGRDIGEVITRRANQQDGIVSEINGDMDARDQVFRKIRNKRALMAGGTAFVVGETLGLGMQEVRAAMADDMQSVFASHEAGETRQSLLASVFRGDGSGAAGHAIETRGADGTTLQAINEHAAVNVPDGYHMQHDGGKWELFDSNNNVVDSNVSFDANGQFSDATKHVLSEKGFSFTHETSTVHDPNTTSYTEHRVSPKEFIYANKDQFTHVHRDLWYDENTPDTYDQNELKLQWGGHDGTGINKHGDYVFDVGNMNPDGSFNNGMSADAQQLIREGKMKIALSLTEGTQSRVVMVNINEHGKAVIPHDSVLGKALFEKHDGQAKFVGGYAEAVQLGENKNGIQHMKMLATVVGENKPNADALTERVAHVQHHTHELVTSTLTPPAIEATPVSTVEMPPVIPVRSRRGLEYPGLERSGYGYAYGYGQNPEYWKRWDKERSPRLRRDPDADLDTGEELSWYRDEQRKLRGGQYLNEIDGYIDGSKAFNEIDDTTKAIVCIPVAAANEAENIYHTLKMFANQPDAEARQSTVIALNVNWKQSLEKDPEQMENILKTQREIARAQADFPDLKIATFNKVWSDEFVKGKQGKIYGEVIKVLYDTAALAMDRAVKNGRRQSSTEALLITNDADTLGLGRHYLRNYLNALERNPTTDVFSATIRRGTQSYKDFPGYGVSSEFYATLNMMMQRQQKTGNGGFTTEGPNSGIRMSMYAAIGGVEDRIGAGADAVLGQRIHAARREPASRTVWDRLRRRETNPGSKRIIGSYVGGAQVDTLPDRLLGAYRQGKWIARGWDSFDNGGYEGRDVSMGAGTLDREDPKTDMDAIAERITRSVEGFASHWYREPAVVSSALAFTFGVNTEDTKLYEYKWDWSKSGDGTFTFSFTDEGKKVLQNRLTRDKRGRYDTFGNRLSRQLYNKTGDGAAKTPQRSEARMLS